MSSHARIHTCMHTYAQDVLECSFYHVLDGLTVENNHFDGRYIAATCSPSPIVPLHRSRKRSLSFPSLTFRRFSTKPRRKTEAGSPLPLFTHANLIKQLAFSTTLTRSSEYARARSCQWSIWNIPRHQITFMSLQFSLVL